MEIMSYLQKIQALRDSIGITSPLGNACIGAVLMNPDSFDPSWREVREILSRPHNRISELEYSSLAWFFTLLTEIEGQVQFLNYLAEPFQGSFFPARPGPDFPWDSTPFTVCSRKIANIQIFLAYGIATNIELQMDLHHLSSDYERLELERQDMMQRFALLSVIASVEFNPNAGTSSTHVFVGNASGPFSLRQAGADIQLTFTQSEVLPSTNSLMSVDIQERNVRISTALDSGVLAAYAVNTAGTTTRTRHVFDEAAFLREAVISTVSGILTAAAWRQSGRPDAMRHVLNILNAADSASTRARGVINDIDMVVEHAILSHYIQDFFLEGITITEIEIGVVHAPQILKWPSPYTHGSMVALNGVIPRIEAGSNAIPAVLQPLFAGYRTPAFAECEWHRFLANPTDGFEIYRYMFQRFPRLMGDFRNAVEANRLAQRNGTNNTTQTQTQTQEEEDRDDPPPDRGPEAPVRE